MVDNLLLNATIKRGVQKESMFRKQANYLLSKIIETDKTLGTIPEVEINEFKEFASINMAIGSELTKHKYTLIGITIGAAGTFAVLKLRKMRKSKKA